MRTGACITARLKSERLPGKALRPLLGRPMAGHLIDRLRAISFRPQIVLCTSTLPSDDALADFAASENIACFRGHPEDVLRRLRDAALAHGFDQVLSTTADNPLTDARSLEELFLFHVAGDFDFSRCSGLPWGAFGYSVSTDALQRACALKGTDDTEVWGGYFTQTGRFRCGELKFESPERHWPELRVTVDTDEDFQLVERIFRELHRSGATFGIEEVISLCRRHPELSALNAGVRQKAAPPIRLREESA